MAKKERAPLILPPFDAERITITYHRDSDTLMVHLVDMPRVATSREMATNLFYRVDRETNEVVSFQVENFLRAVAPQRPEMLRDPKSLGITEADIRAARPRPFWRRIVRDLPKRRQDPATCDPTNDRPGAWQDLDRVLDRRLQLA